MDTFLFIPATALGCYLIVLLSVLTLSMQGLRRLFAACLSVYIMWTLGSVCMRLGIGPSLDFWFHVSLAGIFLIPAATMVFMDAYMYRKISKLSIITLAVCLIFYATNLVTDGWLVSAPTSVMTKNGVQFIYENLGIQVAIPYVGFVGITILLILRMRKGVREGFLQKREYIVLAVGYLVLLVGNMLITIATFAGIPVDMASGIPNAFCIMIVIGMSPMIREYREAATRRTEVFCLVIPAALSLMFMLTCENFVANFLRVEDAKNRTYIVTIFTILFYVVMHVVTKKLMGKMFIDESELQVIQMTDFQKNLRNLTEVSQVEEHIRTTAKHWLGTDFAELLVFDKNAGVYMTTDNFHGGMFLLRRQNAFVKYLMENRRCVILADLQFDSLEIGIRQQVRELRQRRIELVQPLFLEDELYAILVTSGRKRGYQTVEGHRIEVLAEAGMDAIRKITARP